MLENMQNGSRRENMDMAGRGVGPLQTLESNFRVKLHEDRPPARGAAACTREEPPPARSPHVEFSLYPHLGLGVDAEVGHSASRGGARCELFASALLSQRMPSRAMPRVPSCAGLFWPSVASRVHLLSAEVRDFAHALRSRGGDIPAASRALHAGRRTCPSSSPGLLHPGRREQRYD